MSKKTTQKFFNLYKDNLNIVKVGPPKLVMEPDVDDIFMCPLCFDKYFPATAIDNDVLSLEHVPPKKLGGKVRTLTCKACNNKSGTELEGQLKKLLEFAEFWQADSGSPLEIRYSWNDSAFLPATLSKSSGGLRIIGQPHRSNPRDLADIMHSTVDNNRFELRIPTYKSRHAQAAILKIAYLYAFSILGYSFLINPNLRPIRGQIRHPDESILPAWGIAHNDNLPENALGINLVVEPAELQSFIVIFDLTTPSGMNSRWSVVLPGPSQPGLNIYQWLNEHEGTSVQYRIEPVPRDLNFVDRPFATYDMWNNWR